MDDLQLLIALHRDAARQGPGGEAETKLAIALSGLPHDTPLRIADIGCGTGASTLVLAQALEAQITAVDFLPDFLAKLEEKAAKAGLSGRIETLAAAMEDLPFEDDAYDAIWSEGAIYNIGFERGVAAWRRYLKPGGILAVSELTWLTADRPAALQEHWQQEYGEVDTAAAKLAVLERQGFSPIGYFVLPEACWLDSYYGPMERRFDVFRAALPDTAAADAVIESERREMALYRRFKAYFGYGFYIARKP